jgi:hypothetical protein
VTSGGPRPHRRRLCTGRAKVTPSRVAAASLVLAGMTIAAGARAGSSARLTYARSTGASSCPDESALRNAVATRVGYDPFFPWAKRTFVVQVWRDHGRYMARLQIIDEQGFSHGTRELASSGRDCAELFDTAALAISIAIDELPKDETPPVTDTVAAPPQPEDAISPAVPPPPPPMPAAPPVSREPPATAPSAHARIAVGVDAVGSLGTAPAPAAGVSVFLGARWRSASGSFELRADAPASADSNTGSGRVTGSSYAAALVPCVHYGDAFLCAVGVLGLLHGEASGIAAPRSAPPTAVVAAGGRVGFEWPLSPRVALRARLDLMVDLRPTTFVIDGQDAWTARTLAGAVGAGIFAYLE